MKKTLFAMTTIAAMSSAAATSAAEIGIDLNFEAQAFDIGKILDQGVTTFEMNNGVGLSFFNEDDFQDWRKQHRVWRFEDGKIAWEDLPDQCISAICLPEWWDKTRTGVATNPLAIGNSFEWKPSNAVGLFGPNANPEDFPLPLRPYILTTGTFAIGG